MWTGQGEAKNVASTKDRQRALERARYERVFNWLSFKGTNSIIGRAVIVHEKADDLKSQPARECGDSDLP